MYPSGIIVYAGTHSLLAKLEAGKGAEYTYPPFVDLAEAPTIGPAHLAAALQYRPRALE